ncbi:hypothetical protein BpHYR1_008509 [Brachionus plicatilis]|uniref:Uncharacterized protein n=1 Tax=Brachionus plicatilis TaxID=10195 RepID=A0A3M7T4M6_BRAPC|nr:hypothetical protein BpHYR1_008509 [Brachionus plicatilis]
MIWFLVLITKKQIIKLQFRCAVRMLSFGLDLGIRFCCRVCIVRYSYRKAECLVKEKRKTFIFCQLKHTIISSSIRYDWLM